jgi:general secretion pathway protein H
MMRKVSHVCAKEAGFTLIELIAVLGILALAAGMVMPRLSAARQNLKLKAAAVQLVSNLKLTRAAALKSNEDRALVIDLGARRYWSEGAVAPKTLTRDINVSFNVRAGEVVGSAKSFRFRPDGTASGGTVRLALGGEVALVAVDWLTGHVHLSWR